MIILLSLCDELHIMNKELMAVYSLLESLYYYRHISAPSYDFPINLEIGKLRC